METISGPDAFAFSSRISAVTCVGDVMLRRAPVNWSRSNNMTPPRPCSRIARAIQSPGLTDCPRKPTINRLAIFLRSSASLMAVGLDWGDSGDRGGGDGGEGDGAVAGAGVFVDEPHAARPAAATAAPS